MYVNLLAGLIYGFAFPKREGEILRLLGWYCLLATVSVVGGLLERMGVKSVLLGTGVFGADWVTYRTGETVHSEVFSEEVLYNPNQETPALSSYFELMDRLVPGFLGTLSSQKIKGTRTLLR